MKSIKISDVNAIEAALKSVNGKASAHCFNSGSEIAALATAAETMLENFGIAKSRWAGAVFVAISGDRVSNAYAKRGRQRNATRVRLERRAGGWVLADIQAVTVWQEGGGQSLGLTKAQADEAHNALQKKFFVQSETVK